MRRAIVYLNWKAAWWRERSSLRIHEDETILSGVSDYAHKQAAICSHMAERCAVYWLLHLREKGIMPTWEGDYEHLLHDLVGVEEEQEGVTLNGQEEGDEEIEYEGHEEEEIEVEIELDDDVFDIDY